MRRAWLRRACGNDRGGLLHSPAGVLGILLAASLLAPGGAGAASLAPSRAGLMRQVQVAESHGYAYLADVDEVRRHVETGHLVRLHGNRDYVLKQTVSLPYARPEVKLFIERLSRQMRSATGERLVVTSLVRPKSRQPRNASPLSVHPTGIAIDLRVPAGRRARSWLESTLLGLEARRVLEAARERRPPHYHVVLFPEAYRADLDARGVLASAGTGAGDAVPTTYRVRRGDTLWGIAHRHRTTVGLLQRMNGLASTLIQPGQVLHLPG